MAEKKQTKSEKALDRKVELLYRQHCCNIPIDVFDIGKVFAVGRAAAAAVHLGGTEDERMRDAIVGFVDLIRKDRPEPDASDARGARPG